MCVSTGRPPFLLVPSGVASGTQTSTAEPSQSLVVGNHAKPDLSVTELEDIRQLAADLKLPLDEAIARFGPQDDFLAVLELLQNEYSDVYAGAAYLPTERADAWIALTTRPDDKLLSVLAALPLLVEVYTAAPIDAVELTNAEQELFAAASEDPGIAAVEAGVDPRSGSVELTYVPAADAVNDFALQRLARKLHVNLTVSQVDAVTTFEDAAVHGGEAINDCTAAFTGTYSGGAPVITTAGHCNNNQASYGGYSAPFWGEVNGVSSNGDIQWHYIPGATIENKFRYTSAGGLRYILGKPDPVAGQGACYWGKTTGNHCTTVSMVNKCLSGSSCKLFFASNHTAAGGDSGGPWYWNNNGIGVMKGYTTSGTAMDFASMISTLSTAGVDVKVN